MSTPSETGQEPVFHYNLPSSVTASLYTSMEGKNEKTRLHSIQIKKETPPQVTPLSPQKPDDAFQVATVFDSTTNQAIEQKITFHSMNMIIRYTNGKPVFITQKRDDGTKSSVAFVLGEKPIPSLADDLSIHFTENGQTACISGKHTGTLLETSLVNGSCTAKVNPGSKAHTEIGMNKLGVVAQRTANLPFYSVYRHNDSQNPEYRFG